MSEPRLEPQARRRPEGFYRAAEDRELLALAAEAHDDRAFEEIVRRYENVLYTFALRLTSSPADAAEAVQEALLAAWRARAGFRGDSKVSTWLYTITRSKALDCFRRREAATSVAEPPDADAPHDGAAGATARLDILDALRALPLEFREVAVLADILALPLAEIARVTDAPENTVKTRLFRARGRLARLLTEEDESADA